MERRSYRKVGWRTRCQGRGESAVRSTPIHERVPPTHFATQARGPPLFPTCDVLSVQARADEGDDSSKISPEGGGRGALLRTAPAHRESHSETAHCISSRACTWKASACMRLRWWSAQGARAIRTYPGWKGSRGTHRQPGRWGHSGWSNFLDEITAIRILVGQSQAMRFARQRS